MNKASPSSSQVIRILMRMATRRYVNRLASTFVRRKKAPPGQTATRQATPRKSGVRVLAIFLVAVLLLPQGFFFSTTLLQKFAAWANEEPGETTTRIRLDFYAYRKLLEFHHIERRGRAEEPLSESDRKRLLSILGQDVDGQGSENDQGPSQRVAAYEKSGVDAFRGTPRVEPWAGFILPAPAHENRFLLTIAVFVSLLLFALAILALGMGNQDLARIEWSFEWLFTLPIGTRTLFAAKALEHALLTTFPWFTLFPFFIVLYWNAGFSWIAIGIALGVTAYLNLLLGCFRALAETWLRKRLSLSRLKNLQALTTVVGILCMYSLFYFAFGRTELPHWFTSTITATPPWLLWTPTGLPSLLAASTNPAWVPGLAMSCLGIGALLGTAQMAAWLVQDGLIKNGGGPFQGTRTRKISEQADAAVTSRSPLSPRLRGIVAKELTLLRRDRSFFVQTLIVPILVIGFQLVVNPTMLQAGGNNLQHGAMIAFGIGAYVLMFGAFSTLAVEGNGLWLLYTLPRPLSSLLRQKATLWAALSFLYTSSVLALLVYKGRSLDLTVLPSVLMALTGSIIYAFIAAGLGVLGTNPLEEVVQRKVQPTYHYLYLLMTSLYAYGIYAPELWSKIVVVVLTSLLAYALWQKVKERLPYLLDPTAAPPPAILLADGLVAVFAFFALQGFVAILVGLAYSTPEETAPLGLTLTIAFGVAGGLVTLATFYFAWRNKVPRLLQTLGLRGEPGKSWPLHWALGLGVVAGVAAAATAQVYLRLAETRPWLRELKEKSMDFGNLLGEDDAIWLIILAVVLAPIFEEIIFRGLVFRGLRRSVGRWAAVLGSGALFAIVHPPFSAIPVFVLGVAAAFTLELSGLLIAPIAAHAVYNAVAIWVR